MARPARSGIAERETEFLRDRCALDEQRHAMGYERAPSYFVVVLMKCCYIVENDGAIVYGFFFHLFLRPGGNFSSSFSFAFAASSAGL